MSDYAAPPGILQEVALQTLLRLIASRDRSMASRLLAESPSLARQALDVGATRAEESPYYFEEIARFVYAGDTPLHIAAAAYETDIAEELVSRGAHVRARNRRGAEPLHYAVDGIPGSDAWDPEAQYAIVEFLIQAGANPNATDKSGVAPLHRAVRTRCAAAVRALLMNEADALRRNKRGSTPLHLAIQNTGRGGTGSAAAREAQEEIIRLLLSHGARLSDKNAAGRSVQECVTADWIRALLSQA
jgi:ankyrin repeat protein